jgi:hypothetical protein
MERGFTGGRMITPAIAKKVVLAVRPLALCFPTFYPNDKPGFRIDIGEDITILEEPSDTEDDAWESAYFFLAFENTVVDRNEVRRYLRSYTRLDVESFMRTLPELDDILEESQ